MKTSVPQLFSKGTLAARPPEPVRGLDSGIAFAEERWEAVQLGAEAARIAVSSELSGVVVAATSRAIYVENGAGEIFGLGCHLSAAHTRMIIVRPQISIALPFTEPGAIVTSTGQNLLFGSSAFVDLGLAPAESGPFVEPASAAPVPLAARSVSQALAAGVGMHQGENLGLLLKGMAGCAGPPKNSRISDVTLDSATQHASQVASQCRSGGLAEAVSGLGRLIGLGPGLTPSGDDFAGGLLFAASHLAHAYGPDSPWAAVDPSAALERWAGRTNRISCAYLGDFARGQGPFPMHGLMCDLLGGGTGNARYSRYIREVASIGHSSGWDMLAGMFAGLLALNATVGQKSS